MSELGETFERLVGIVRRLRAPDGCPWDRAQTHETLRPYALEEAREVVLAIGDGDSDALRDELGDVLLQVLLHSAIAEESGRFCAQAVMEGLAAKLIRRHPHVFGGTGPAADPEDVERRWAQIKEAEAAAKGSPGGKAWLSNVSPALPALAEAQALGARAAEVGFDWPDAAQAWPKVQEEAAELAAAWAAWDRAGRPAGALQRALEEELGDLLFAAVNVARLLGLDAEMALIGTNAKFRRRFAQVEAAFDGKPDVMRRAGLAALDDAWHRAKAGEIPAHTAE